MELHLHVSPDLCVCLLFLTLENSGHIAGPQRTSARIRLALVHPTATLRNSLLRNRRSKFAPFSPQVSLAEPKNVADGAQKCRRRSPTMSPAEPKTSPADPKNVADGAQKCRRRSPQMPKKRFKQILSEPHKRRRSRRIACFKHPRQVGW